MAINFYQSRGSIYALFRKRKYTENIYLTYYPGIFSNNEWNAARQRFNPKTLELEALNKQLVEIEIAFNKVLEKHGHSSLDNTKLATFISEMLKPETKKATPFYEYCDTYFQYAIDRFTRRRSQSIQTTINKLKEFDPELTFEKIDKRFYRDFLEFLKEKNLALNYIGSQIKNLKRIMNYATENDANSAMAYRDFKKPQEDVYNVYLTEAEIERIYNLRIDETVAKELQKKNPKLSKTSIDRQISGLDRARKLFVIGCWTGLRVENYRNIDPDIQIDLANRWIHAIANKNGPKLKIPIHEMVREIIETDQFPLPISAQHLNEHVKVLGRLAGITETVIYSRTEGVRRVEHAKKKYEMITTHTARRSFASNLLSRGIPKQFIMAVTGHRTEVSFNKYTAAVQKDIMTAKLADYDVWGKVKPTIQNESK